MITYKGSNYLDIKRFAKRERISVNVVREYVDTVIKLKGRRLKTITILGEILILLGG